MVIFRIPGRYLSKNATPEEKEVFEAYKAQLDGVLKPEGIPYIFLPSEYDAETRTPLFNLEVV